MLIFKFTSEVTQTKNSNLLVQIARRIIDLDEFILKNFFRLNTRPRLKAATISSVGASNVPNGEENRDSPCIQIAFNFILFSSLKKIINLNLKRDENKKIKMNRLPLSFARQIFF